METGFSYRAMAVTDIPQVMQIEQVSFPDPWTARTYKQELTDNTHAYYTVLVDQKEQVIGYCGYWMVLEEAQVTKIAVHPAYRSKGWGKKLLLHCMDQAKALGAIEMTLEVRASNTCAQKLYQKLGFVMTGTRPRFYKISPEDAMMMWVDLS